MAIWRDVDPGLTIRDFIVGGIGGGIVGGAWLGWSVGAPPQQAIAPVPQMPVAQQPALVPPPPPPGMEAIAPIAPQPQTAIADTTQVNGYSPTTQQGSMGDWVVVIIGVAGAGVGIWWEVKKERAGQVQGQPPKNSDLFEDWQDEEAIASNEQPVVAEAEAQPIGDGAPPTLRNDWQERREGYLEMMKAECPQLLKVMEATPVLCAGPQRSGKTTLAIALALSRQVLLGHRVEVATPHQGDNLPPSFRVFPRNWEGVEQAIAHYFELIGNHDTTPSTLIFDEFTNYKGAELEGADGLMMSFLAESQKHEKFIIALSHGLTNNALGGASGSAEMRKQGLVIIERKNQISEMGRRSPSPTVRLSGIGESSESFEIPEWFNPETILQIFPELAEKKQVRSQNPGNAPAHEEAVLAAVYEWASRQGKAIKARDVQGARIAEVDGFSADHIRAIFIALEQSGRGKTYGAGSSMSYHANPASR